MVPRIASASSTVLSKCMSYWFCLKTGCPWTSSVTKRLPGWPPDFLAGAPCPVTWNVCPLIAPARHISCLIADRCYCLFIDSVISVVYPSVCLSCLSFTLSFVWICSYGLQITLSRTSSSQTHSPHRSDACSPPNQYFVKWEQNLKDLEVMCLSRHCSLL